MQKLLANLTRQQLFDRCAELERELSEREPLRFGEYQLIRRVLGEESSSAADSEKPYATVKWPRQAILLCLERVGRWMTRKQIKRELEQGGFLFDPATFDNLLADALRYHTSSGKLSRRDEDGNLIEPGKYKPGTRFRNEQYGLAAWANDPTIGQLEEI